MMVCVESRLYFGGARWGWGRGLSGSIGVPCGIDRPDITYGDSMDAYSNNLWSYVT
ncbi:hypothetical protein FMEAI12_3890041 [Parafrankia sp. Ea1.12]|nr:hypothetical protein FMEAI12_3890041 [Parafrankia sp. Ea1.12]